MSCRTQYLSLEHYSITYFLLWKQTSFSILTNFFLFSFSASPLLRIYPRMMLLCCYMFWHKSHQLFFSPSALTDCEEICRFQQFLMRKLSYCFANSQISVSPGNGLIAMFCHHYANKSVFIRMIKSRRSKSL